MPLQSSKSSQKFALMNSIKNHTTKLPERRRDCNYVLYVHNRNLKVGVIEQRNDRYDLVRFKKNGREIGNRSV